MINQKLEKGIYKFIVEDIISGDKCPIIMNIEEGLTYSDYVKAPHLKLISIEKIQ